jgi:1-acyl-sn-glycerol-3-phosphate acyltransferase
MSPVRLLSRMLYGIYAWLVFLVVLPSVLIPIALLPDIAQRRRAAMFGIRLIAGAIRNPIAIEGLEHLPDGPAIVAANHISYLDGPLMLFALPPRFSFVVKAEAEKVPVFSLIMRRMGVKFITRYDARRGASDARQLMRVLEGGQSLGFFPEGHIQRKPGLQAFRLGAFLIAAHCGAPVVPAVIRGTRKFMPRNYWWPTRSAITIRLLPAIHPEGSNREAAIRLRDRTFTAVLAHCEESAAAQTAARHEDPVDVRYQQG